MYRTLDMDPATIFAPDEAERVAEEMTEADEDWTYQARHDPSGNGGSLIDAYDEDGECVGTI